MSISFEGYSYLQCTFNRYKSCFIVHLYKQGICKEIENVAFMQFSYSRTPGSCISHRDVEGGPCFGRKHPIRQACLGVSVMGKNQSQSYFLKPISISQLSINFDDVLPICISLNFWKKVMQVKNELLNLQHFFKISQVKRVIRTLIFTCT